MFALQVTECVELYEECRQTEFILSSSENRTIGLHLIYCILKIKSFAPLYYGWRNVYMQFVTKLHHLVYSLIYEH